MAIGDGLKIGIKFTEEIVEPTPDMSDYIYDEPTIRAYVQGHVTGASSSALTTPAETKGGDLLLCFWAKDDDDAESFPVDWTQLARGSYTYHAHAIYYKTATEDGAEQFAVTHDSESTKWIILAIPFGDVPVVSSAFNSIGTSAPNPPAITSGFDADTPTLWIASMGCDSDDVTGFPANFTENNIKEYYDGSVAIATKSSTNASEDPDAFAISSDSATAFTTAVKLKPYDDVLADRISSAIMAGFTVSGEVPQYVEYPAETLGPLSAEEYMVIGGEMHPTEEKSILLTMSKGFKNVEGDLTIAYDASAGNLMGVGGAVAPFEQDFTPADLIRVPNPWMPPEIIGGSITGLEVGLQEITWTPAYGPEYVDMALTGLSIELIHVDDLNP